jgi:hypothetical protein
MRYQPRPETVELFAKFAEKAGLLAAAVIRQQPTFTYDVACTLYYTVLTCARQAYTRGAQELSMSKAWQDFTEAWRESLTKGESDMDPTPPDKTMLN